MPIIPNDFQWEPVVIPLVEGLDVDTRARLVEKTKLLKAENVFYSRTGGGGPEIRNGHRAYTVVNSSASLVGNPPSVDNFLYGYGLMANTNPTDNISSPGSPYSQSGSIKGLATRDNEILAWDGSSLYSYHSADNGFTKHTAYMPTARTSVIAKTSYAQSLSDAGDNGYIKVVSTINTTNNTAEVFCYDSISGGLRFSQILGISNVDSTRVVPLGSHIHVYVRDSSANNLYLYVIHQDVYTVGSFIDIGECSVSGWDHSKVSELLILLAKIDNSGAIRLIYINSNGTTNTDYFTANLAVDLSGEIATKVSIAVDFTTMYFCIFWYDNAKTSCWVKAYDSTGAAYDAKRIVNTTDTAIHITCSVSYLWNSASPIFYLFRDRSNTSVATFSYKYDTSLAPQLTATRYNVGIASKAFTVGQVAFLYTYWSSVLQTQYLLMDINLTLNGRLEYGTAVANPLSTWLPSVNWMYSSSIYDTYNFHCAILYKLRTIKQSNPTPTTTAVFEEISTKFVEMNFMPKFTYAQAGRSTYFPGAQLWSYDGVSLTEANFIVGPEDVTIASSNSGGGLVPADKYRYRIYLVHKNAVGEEVRSLAFLSDEKTVGGGHNNMVLTGKTIPTNRSDSYFLIYRNEKNTGTLWYLISSRDPNSAPQNNQSSATWTFTDSTADPVINTELDPANNTSWIQPWAAPSCEVIAFGKDRLWIAGGEMLAGEVWASRLFYSNEVPSFSPVLSITVDRDKESIQAINFTADLVYVFQNKDAHILVGEFSSNIFTGNTIRSQLALTEIGAISPYTARLSQGILFQSDGGFRLVDAGASINNIGVNVNTISSGELSSIIICYKDRTVRFYQSDMSSPVLSYESGQWSTFTLQPQAAVINPVTGFAVLAVDNKLYFEEEDLYTDDSKSYSSKIRTAWLNAVLGGFQRIRKIGAIGEFYSHCLVRCNIYMDEAVSPIESFEWLTNIDLASAGWGDGTWGSGFWGDPDDDGNFAARDSVWRFIRRLSRQKCSAISLELVFNSIYGKCAIPTAFLLELGNKNKLDRVPTRTYGPY